MADQGSRQKLVPWILKNLNTKSIPGLEWIDEEQGLFRIPWTHHGRQESPSMEDIAVFRAWAVHTGSHRDGLDNDQYSTWKTRIRNALHKSKGIKERKDLHDTHASIRPHRVYQLDIYNGVIQSQQVDNVHNVQDISAASQQSGYDEVDGDIVQMIALPYDFDPSVVDIGSLFPDLLGFEANDMVTNHKVIGSRSEDNPNNYTDAVDELKSSLCSLTLIKGDDRLNPGGDNSADTAPPALRHSGGEQRNQIPIPFQDVTYMPTDLNSPVPGESRVSFTGHTGVTAPSTVQQTSNTASSFYNHGCINQSQLKLEHNNVYQKPQQANGQSQTIMIGQQKLFQNSPRETLQLMETDEGMYSPGAVPVGISVTQTSVPDQDDSCESLPKVNVCIKYCENVVEYMLPTKRGLCIYYGSLAHEAEISNLLSMSVEDVEHFHLPTCDKLISNKRTQDMASQLLKNLDKGLVLEWCNNDIYATRFCRCSIFYTNYEMKDKDALKLERKKRTKVYEHNKWSEQVHQIGQGSHEDADKIFIGFGQRLNWNKRKNTRAVCISMMIQYNT